MRSFPSLKIKSITSYLKLNRAPKTLKSAKIEDSIEDQGLKILKLEGEYKTIETYPIHSPHSQVKIIRSPKLGVGNYYFIEEKETPRDEAPTPPRKD